VPIIYTTAGNAPGVSPSIGIAMATTIGYAGFFVGPPVIGYLADGYGLRIGLAFPLLLLAIMLVLIAKVNFDRFMA
jgi:MFS family permease